MNEELPRISTPNPQILSEMKTRVRTALADLPVIRGETIIGPLRPDSRLPNGLYDEHSFILNLAKKRFGIGHRSE